ncbi:uncharacterized protein LOC115241347 [Formica exsecta]|uniref:uncharacterized protein LOC115241347 n=1 Tax=Formica exsecta TaxID=72781 RepID=UPI00114131F1|nr:uncharacterized protein LOC115241347 [Formica exsecta]
MEKVSEEKSISEGWKKGVIYPIFKKRDIKDFKNYRGVTLLDTSYKVYASILNEKLKEEMKDRYEETQFGFRKGRGISDAIYLLNFMIHKKLRKQKVRESVCVFRRSQVGVRQGGPTNLKQENEEDRDKQ